jgi:hypothetical protein
MKNISTLIDGVITIVIGICTFFLWKRFAIEIQKFNFVKYAKPQEIGIKVCFYIIGVLFVIGGIYLLYKFFK